jgi:hypothetical protein
MKTLKELNEELDDFIATLNDENEDTPELLAEQERLLNAIIAAEAADLGALSVKELVAHFAKRAPGQHLAGVAAFRARKRERVRPVMRAIADAHGYKPSARHRESVGKARSTRIRNIGHARVTRRNSNRSPILITVILTDGAIRSVDSSSIKSATGLIAVILIGLSVSL